MVAASCYAATPSTKQLTTATPRHHIWPPPKLFAHFVTKSPQHTDHSTKKHIFILLRTNSCPYQGSVVAIFWSAKVLTSNTQLLLQGKHLLSPMRYGQLWYWNFQQSRNTGWCWHFYIACLKYCVPVWQNLPQQCWWQARHSKVYTL